MKAIHYKDITIEELKEIFKRNSERITVVEFVKKNSGYYNDPIIRKMKCTRSFDMLERFADEMGYKKPTNAPLYHAASYNLLRVWDIENEGWRSIPVDRILEITSEEYPS